MRRDFEELVRAGRVVRRELPDGGSTLLVEKIAIAEAWDPETRSVSIVASDETRDRYGDVIVASGWSLENYSRNPVVLIDHEYRVQSIVGKAEVKVVGKKLKAKITLDESEMNGAARMVEGLLDRGLLRAVSVGFMPLDWEWLKDKDGNVTGIKYLEQELLEISWVAVPANPNATLGVGGEGKDAVVPDDAVGARTGEELPALATQLLAAAAAVR